MKNTIVTTILLLFSFQVLLQAQTQMFERLSYPVEVNNIDLKFPFAGGLNAPQFSQADLNHDGLQDLVIFDRAGNIPLTFLNNGTVNAADYTFAPEYACYFPALVDYVQMRDFNKDGAADIFTSSIALGRQEIQVYRGYYDGDVLKFTNYYFKQPGCLTCDSLYVYYPDGPFWNNLPINKGDIPAFDDIDGDGDLDIVTFESSAGGHVWLIDNKSVEMGLGLDDMRFDLTTQCWGGFYESGIDACYCDLAPTTDCCAPCAVGPVDERNGAHPGSTLMTYDQEGDGDKEIVLGDISFSCLNYLENGGSNTDAWMTSQQTGFPDYDVPVDLSVYPAAFYLDVDNDGKKDMIVAPNNPTISEDRKNVWYYKNTASSGHHFELQQTDLFTGNMIDIGTVAHPAFADVNGDGLTDLVVGNYGFHTPGVAVNGRLTLFLNTGTPFAPKFQLADNDWLGMSEFTPGDYDFAPTFGDIDGDGAKDLIVGSNIGGVYCYRNHAGPDDPMDLSRDFDVMWVNMDVVGSVSTPFLYDLDKDNLVDLVVGERTGYVNFFRNMGTATNPIFPAVPTYGKVGQIDTRTPTDPAGYAAPVIIETTDGPVIIVGAQGGHLEAYFVSENYEDTFFLTDEKWGNIDVGSRSHPALADIDADGMLEMVVGNYRGGLEMFKTTLVDCGVSAAIDTPSELESRLLISPNPANDWVKLQWAGYDGQWRIFNSLGQIVGSGSLDHGLSYIDVKTWPAGVYVIEAASGNKRQSGKMVVK